MEREKKMRRRVNCHFKNDSCELGEALGLSKDKMEVLDKAILFRMKESLLSDHVCLVSVVSGMEFHVSPEEMTYVLLKGASMVQSWKDNTQDMNFASSVEPKLGA